MQLFPAIDLYEGKAVRLFKGDYNQMTIYSNDPVAVAKDFECAGAKNIHLVDLEGAKTGETPNFDIVKNIAKSTSLFIEIGGGVRNMDVVEKYLSAGVGRVILGTSAVQNPEFLADAIKKYGEKIAVGVDLKDGYVAIKGWVEKSQFSCDEFFKKLQETGAKYVICTDVSRDGAMQGTNLALYSDLSKKYDINLIASGGISTMDDIKALKNLSLHGAIIGKAYYTGAIDLKDALKVAK